MSVWRTNQKTSTMSREVIFSNPYVLPTMVPMHRLQDFKRKLKIPIQHFWKPEEAEADAEAKRKLESED